MTRTNSNERVSTLHCCSTVRKKFSVSCIRFEKATRLMLFDRTAELRSQSVSYMRFLVLHRDKYHRCHISETYTTKEIDMSVRYLDSVQNSTPLYTGSSCVCGKEKRKKCYLFRCFELVSHWHWDLFHLAKPTSHSGCQVHIQSPPRSLCSSRNNTNHKDISSGFVQEPARHADSKDHS